MEPCPHCRCKGALILHGFLYGYLVPGGKQKKAHRVFCSNRNRRPGCGRTFAVRMAMVIQKLAISTKQLWSFLNNICAGIPIKHALGMQQPPFDKLKTPHYSTASIYRLYQRFKLRQHTIRTKLLELAQPPPVNNSTNPIRQTTEHLRTAFSDQPCPISAFQHHFQTAIL